MPEYSSGRGIFSTWTQIWISGRFMISRIRLPMYSDAISVQTSVPWSSNSCGPGCTLKIWNAASITAAVAEVGRPRVSSGTSTPENDALFAASGPATPSIAPSPNSSRPFLRARRRSIEYDRNVGTSAPPDGIAPNGNPSAVPRSHGAHDRPQSDLVQVPGPQPALLQYGGTLRSGPQLRRHVQRLADREQPDDHDHHVDPVEQSQRAERVPRRAGQLSRPISPMNSPTVSDSSPRTSECPTSAVTATIASSVIAK